jgi:hypothetical protein
MVRSQCEPMAQWRPVLSLPRFSASAPGGPQRERDGAVSGERDGQRESGQQRRGGLRTVPDGAVGLGDRLRRAGTGAGGGGGDGDSGARDHHQNGDQHGVHREQSGNPDAGEQSAGVHLCSAPRKLDSLIR